MSAPRLAVDFDVAVIGGGPGGAAAAIRLRQRGFHVLLVEKDAFPRDKLCGEFLSPEVRRLAADLEVGDALRAAAPARLHHAQLHVYGEPPLDVPLAAPALGLSRAAFDDLLVRRAATAGAKVRARTAVEAVERLHIGGFALTCREKGAVPGSVRAAAVVCAAGRWNRWTLPPPPNANGSARFGRAAFGFKAHYEAAVATDGLLDMHFFPGGYCGVSRIEGGRANVCCLVEKRVLQSAGRDPETLLRRQPALAAQLARGRRLTDFLFAGPLFFRRPQPISDALFRVGDAAAFIDPFCGDGMSIALHSGLLAADAVVPFLEGRVSLEDALSDYARLYRRAFRRQFFWSGVLRRLTESPWAARLGVRVVRGSKSLRRRLFTGTRSAACPADGAAWDWGELVADSSGADGYEA